MNTKKNTTPYSVFQTVHMLKRKGLSTAEAIAEVESVLRATLPPHIKDMIYRECN